MKKLTGKFVLASILCSIACVAAADDTDPVQALNDAKALLDAQAARDTSEAAAIRAASDLAKAKAAAANVSSDIKAAQNASDAALATSAVTAQTATFAALKTTFGAPPTIGTDGSITITDATSGVLLQTKAGSLEATWLMAEKLCTILAAAGVRDAYIAPPDLDTKIQSARMVLREFSALSAKVKDPKNRKLVGLEGGVRAQVAPAAVLGAVSLLEYGAGALQSIAKLFRSDYAVALSSDATRAAWLEYFIGARCPAQIPRTQLEAVARGQSLDEITAKLNEMQEFYTAATSLKTATQRQIDLRTARIASLKAEKKDTSIDQQDLDKQNQVLTELGTLDAWLPRIQALMTSVSTSPAPFLDALTWNAFGDEQSPLKVSNRPRITIVLTTQDGQVTRSFWLTGKTMYGRSSAELIYRVTMTDGTVRAAGFLTAQSSGGKVDLESRQSTVVDDGHHWPVNATGAIPSALSEATGIIK